MGRLETPRLASFYVRVARWLWTHPSKLVWFAIGAGVGALGQGALALCAGLLAHALTLQDAHELAAVHPPPRALASGFRCRFADALGSAGTVLRRRRGRVRQGARRPPSPRGHSARRARASATPSVLGHCRPCSIAAAARPPRSSPTQPWRCASARWSKVSATARSWWHARSSSSSRCWPPWPSSPPRSPPWPPSPWPRSRWRCPGCAGACAPGTPLRASRPRRYTPASTSSSVTSTSGAHTAPARGSSVASPPSATEPAAPPHAWRPPAPRCPAPTKRSVPSSCWPSWPRPPTSAAPTAAPSSPSASPSSCSTAPSAI